MYMVLVPSYAQLRCLLHLLDVASASAVHCTGYIRKASRCLQFCTAAHGPAHTVSKEDCSSGARSPTKGWVVDPPPHWELNFDGATIFHRPSCPAHTGTWIWSFSLSMNQTGKPAVINLCTESPQSLAPAIEANGSDESAQIWWK